MEESSSAPRNRFFKRRSLNKVAPSPIVRTNPEDDEDSDISGDEEDDDESKVSDMTLVKKGQNSSLQHFCLLWNSYITLENAKTVSRWFLDAAAINIRISVRYNL